jgi:hypothetical protein
MLFLIQAFEVIFTAFMKEIGNIAMMDGKKIKRLNVPWIKWFVFLL